MMWVGCNIVGKRGEREPLINKSVFPSSFSVPHANGRHQRHVNRPVRHAAHRLGDGAMYFVDEVTVTLLIRPRQRRERDRQTLGDERIIQPIQRFYDEHRRIISCTLFATSVLTWPTALAGRSYELWQ